MCNDCVPEPKRARPSKYMSISNIESGFAMNSSFSNSSASMVYSKVAVCWMKTHRDVY